MRLRLWFIAAVSTLLASLVVTAVVPYGVSWRETSVLDLGGWGIDLHGNTLYVAGFYSVSAFNVSEMAHPRRVTEWVGTSCCAFVRAAEPFAYYADNSGFFAVLEVGSDPQYLRPAQQRAYLTFNVTVFDMERAGNRILLFGNENGGVKPLGVVLGINVSNPSQPFEEFRAYLPTPVGDGAIEGARVYLATLGGDVEIWRLTEDGITRVDFIHVRDAPDPWTHGELVGIDILGSWVVVGARDFGLQVISVDPNPVIVSSYQTMSDVLLVALAPDSVFISLSGRAPNGEDRIVEQLSFRSDSGEVAHLRSFVFRYPGVRLAVDSTGTKLFSLGDLNLALAVQVPATLLESSPVAQVVLLASATGIAVSFVVVFVRRARGGIQA